jgi:outer membrane protein assembly factor BamB
MPERGRQGGRFAPAARIFAACAGLCCAACFAGDRPEADAADVAWVAEGGFCEPETVLPLPDDTLLVSNVCGFREAGNGYLSLLDARGAALDWRIVDGLDAPLGMALHDGRLFVLDTNRLRVFTWTGYVAVETIDLPTTVANDLAVAADGVVYVSDTAGHQVIRLDSNGETSVLTGEARFKGANGMALLGRLLYVGGERVWRVDLDDGSVATVGPDWLTDIDGIEFEPDGTIQLTPVGGPLVRYRGEGGSQVLSGPGISSANHGYAPRLGLALIPTGFDNTVIAIRLPAD